MSGQSLPVASTGHAVYTLLWWHALSLFLDPCIPLLLSVSQLNNGIRKKLGARSRQEEGQFSS